MTQRRPPAPVGRSISPRESRAGTQVQYATARLISLEQQDLTQVAFAYDAAPLKPPSSMSFTLLQLSKDALEALAASRIPQGLEGRSEQGAMPPAFVAIRSLELAAAGHPLPWSTTFLIVDVEHARIVGACGFKAVPKEGRVDVGYGVASTARGKGAATAALDLLLRKAFQAGATELLAEVAPDNAASTRVVQKAGFERAGARVDDDGEHVVQWVKRAGSPP